MANAPLRNRLPFHSGACRARPVLSDHPTGGAASGIGGATGAAFSNGAAGAGSWASTSTGGSALGAALATGLAAWWLSISADLLSSAWRSNGFSVNISMAGGGVWLPIAAGSPGIGMVPCIGGAVGAPIAAGSPGAGMLSVGGGV